MFKYFNSSNLAIECCHSIVFNCYICCIYAVCTVTHKMSILHLQINLLLKAAKDDSHLTDSLSLSLSLPECKDVILCVCVCE